MAAPTGHMACAVCLAPSVSVRRSTVVSLVLACHCSFAGHMRRPGRLCCNQHGCEHRCGMLGLAWLLLHLRSVTARKQCCVRRAQGCDSCDSNEYMIFFL